MRVYFNYLPINKDTGEIRWEQKNGATRRTLMVVMGKNNKTKILYDENKKLVYCKLGVLDKGNHSFIFINDDDPNDKRTLGVFLCSYPWCGGYGYTLIKGKELFVNSSVGGYGNSESKFGIYEVGSLIKLHTYKNRQPASYYELTENGWIYRPTEEIVQEINNEEISYI